MDSRRSKPQGKAASVIAWAFAMLLLGLTACSTPRPRSTHRWGLLDLPDADEPTQGRVARMRARGSRAPDSNQSDESFNLVRVRSRTARWRWPLNEVRVTSKFGQRGSNVHEGIDLRAKQGTPVFAVSDGRVLYVGSKIRGYGQLVVIRHSGGLATIYAHNSKLLVKRGQHVVQGQKIALSGQTGHASGPHLHFEVRSGSRALDPMGLMPNVRRQLTDRRGRGRSGDRQHGTGAV